MTSIANPGAFHRAILWYPTSMQAWLLDQPNGIDQLRLGDTPDPAPGRDEVVLEVEFAALNPADQYLAQKQYPARPRWPHILGRDAVGRVIAMGSDVKTVSIGDRRVILRSAVGVDQPGTLAQKVAAAAESLAPYPESWTVQQAAAAPLVYLTAWQALTQWGNLPPGVVAITGASGGVGVASVQLARAMGHTVIALSRSGEKRQKLLLLGAHHAFDPNQPDWASQLKQSLDGRKVDLAIDNIGGPQFPDLISTLGNGGRVSIVGRLAGVVPQFNTSTLLFRRLRLGGVMVGSYSATEAQNAWKQLTTLMQQHQQQPVVDNIFDFAQVPAAFARMEAGPMGKVVIRVG